jgi:hypothetical protein
MRLFCFAFTLTVVTSGALTAQVLYVGGTTYSQNFDTLANTPINSNITWTDNVTLLGWYEQKSNNPDTYRAGNGSHNAGHLWSYGADGSTDRALGSLASGSTNEVFFGLRLKNNHPTWTLTSFTVSFTMEQWRSGKTTAETTFFEYKLTSTPETDIDGTGYTGVSAGDLVAVNLTGSGAIDGNLAANQTAHNFTVTGINWAPGSELWLRWRDPNDAGNDHGMAIDDFSFSAVPEPTTLALVGVGMVTTGLITRRLRRKKAVAVAVSA